MTSHSACKECILDDSLIDVNLDKNGVCNFCNEFKSNKSLYFIPQEESDKKLKELKQEVEKGTSNNQYNCIIGMSGGVDSSYVAHLAGQLELRPLVVHLDNSWNSEIAVKNVKKIVDKLNFDLFTHVINWQEFKDLQRAYFYSSVIDLEVPTDHAITAIIYQQARKHGIKNVLSGGNYRTEHGLPRSWRWDKLDLRNLNHIHSSFGKLKLKSYPKINNLKFLLWHRGVSRIKQHLPLNAVNFKRSDAVDLLQKEYEWKDYGGKHHESIFTKFYQSYVLPKKFKVDKRKAHFSCLIRNEEISRDEALQKVESPAYSNSDLAIEMPFVLKKLDFSQEEFEILMAKDQIDHSHYRNEIRIKSFIESLKSFIS